MKDPLQIAIHHTQEILDAPQVEQSHGFSHALQVLAHAEKMLDCDPVQLAPGETLLVKLAALLHDVDDRKLFAENKNYENARQILQKIGFAEDERLEKVIEMIKLVSTSANGNAIDERFASWMLYPRFADRLEAIGPIGVERCLAYTLHLQRPLFLASTPRAPNEEALWKIATAERFANYLKIKGSVSFIDHFYDKLLHIGTIEALGYPVNPYLVDEATKRHEYMVRYILDFGRTGTV